MRKIFVLYIVLLAIEIILAIICGPYSCDWGNRVYFYYGVAGVGPSFILPLLHKAWRLNKRIAYGFLFLFVSVIVWCAGFMLGGFRILCRLF